MKQRETKFRFWDKTRKEMIEDTVIPSGLFYQILTGGNDNFIPLQYTGLHDKNGEKIYEGDIIKIHDENAGVEFVREGIQWESEGKYYVNFWALRYQPEGFNRQIYPLEDEKGEIIGNIYENPELLEK